MRVQVLYTISPAHVLVAGFRVYSVSLVSSAFCAQAPLTAVRHTSHGQEPNGCAEELLLVVAVAPDLEVLGTIELKRAARIAGSTQRP